MIKLDKLIDLIDDYKDEKGLPPYFESEHLAERIWDALKEEERKEAKAAALKEATKTS